MNMYASIKEGARQHNLTLDELLDIARTYGYEHGIDNDAWTKFTHDFCEGLSDEDLTRVKAAFDEGKNDGDIDELNGEFGGEF